MINSLYKKSFLKISNLTKHEIQTIIKLSVFLKKSKKNHQEMQYLKKKKIALIFEKESTRTRCAFEISAFEQGAYSTYFGPGNMHLGYKESIIDTAKIIERIYDGVQYRGHDHNIIKTLSKCSNIPVWNGLTNKYHPTQLLADLLTMIECLPNKPISEIICAYVGDACNNISNTFIETANIMGFELRFIAPKKYWPKKKILNTFDKKNKTSNITCTENVQEGVENADFIYTDVWISMGDPECIWNDKISLLKHYQVNRKMIQLTKNVNVKVLHCLPALHDQHTKIGKKFSKLYELHDGIEITNEIFQQHSDIIFEQAENRLHTIKALMVATLTNINNIKYKK